MTITNESVLYEEITRAGQSLHARDYVVGTAGNTSVCLPDGWFTIPIDAYLGALDPAHTAEVLAMGEWVSGDKPPKTLALHRGIYDRNVETHVVVHTHSTHLVVLTLADVQHEASVLPPIMSYYVMKVGHVPPIVYRRPDHSNVVVRITVLANDVRTVLLDRLRPAVWHGLAPTATYTLGELEEAAWLWLTTEPRPAPLSDAQIDELCQTFGARWQNNRQQIGSIRRSVHIAFTPETE